MRDLFPLTCSQGNVLLSCNVYMPSWHGLLADSCIDIDCICHASISWFRKKSYVRLTRVRRSHSCIWLLLSIYLQHKQNIFSADTINEYPRSARPKFTALPQFNERLCHLHFHFSFPFFLSGKSTKISRYNHSIVVLLLGASVIYLMWVCVRVLLYRRHCCCINVAPRLLPRGAEFE